MNAAIAQRPNTTGTVFAETLRRGWRTALYWGIGIGLLTLLQIVIIQDDAALQQITQLYSSLPAFMVQGLTGGQDIAFLATPDGYMATRFFSFGLLYFAIYGVLAGLSISANDEDAGILDMVLGLPIRRAQLVIERLAAYAVFAFFIIAIVFGFIVLGTLAVPGVSYNLNNLAAGTFNLLPALLLIVAFSAAMGALLRRRGNALAAAGLFVVGSYFLDFIALGAPNSAIAPLAPLSFFHYLAANETVRLGLQWGNIAFLLGAALVFAAITVFAFERRDIGR